MDQKNIISKSTYSPTVNLGTAIPLFKNLVNRLIRESWEQKEVQEHFQSLAKGMEQMVPDLLAIGEAAAYEVSRESKDFIPWFITFDWTENAKSFLLLWRDILFQEQRAWLKVSAEEVKIEKFEELSHTSKKSILDAASTLFMDLESAVSHPLNNPKQMDRWRLQQIPWPIYKKQLETLPEQCRGLIRQAETLWNASGTFVIIGRHFLESYDFWLIQIDLLKKGLQQLVEKVGKIESDGLLDSAILTQELEQMDDAWEKTSDSEIFHAHLDDFVSRLPAKEKIIADVNGGILLYKELNLRAEVRSWLESELLSEIYELFTIRDGITSKIHLNMVSVKTLLLVDDEGQQLSDKESIIQVLTNFLKSLDRSEERIRELKAIAQRELKKQFTLSNIYKQDFLARSLQYTISQYRDSARWLEIRNWIKKQGARVSQLQRNVLAEEALSISERIVRVVNNRTPEMDNSHYTNMFLTKGWIGDSFVVGRNSELSRVAALVENWKLGFRGTVMLTGKRFSGKTLFGELIDQRFFQNKSIKLMPYTRFILSGKKDRHLDITCDLSAALKFIDRYTVDEHPMIWIDDLEHWQNDKISLAENVNTLLSFMDNNAHRMFFVVATSNWMKAQLATAFEIDKVFQSEINLGYLSSTQIKQAILVRHSATHTVLYNEEKEEMKATELTRIINRISQLSEGNIGDALQRWAYTVEKIDEEKIRLPKPTLHALPPFLSMEAALVLQSIMMEKKSSEKKLKELFGLAYVQTYEISVKRMLNLGILKKEQDQITVNRYLVNDIGKILEKRINFQYNHQTNIKKQVRI